jgi:PAS domain S-box-containing protein
VEDVTRRKQADAQLRAAIVHSPIATGVLADDGRTVSYNEALEGLTGYTADELCTVDDWFQRLCPHPEYRKEVRELFDWMSRGDGPQTRELHITRKDGRERLVQFHISSFEGGQVIQMLDITKQRENEEALRNKQRMLHQLIELHERDRQLMAYELHDGFCQQLASAMMKFQAYQHLRAIDPDEAAKCFDGAMGWLGQSITEARRLIGGLRPPILDEAGIVAAVDYLVAEVAEDQGVRVLFNQNLGCKRLASPLETCLFRIIQESVRNARRYSKSHCVHIDLMEGDDAIVLKVQDWGVGFDTEMVEAGHFGLQGIRERARWLGGHAEIESAPGRGTCITVRLPLVETA